MKLSEINELSDKIKKMEELLNHLLIARDVAYDTCIKKYDIADAIQIQINKLHDNIKKEKEMLSEMISPEGSVFDIFKN